MTLITRQPNDDFASPFEFDMALQEPVHYMMKRGIRVDLGLKKKLLDEANDEWVDLQKKLDGVVGYRVNVSSPKQVKELLYAELGLPERRHKGKPTANEAAIRSLLAYATDKMHSSVRSDTIYKYQRAALVCLLLLKIRSVRKKISSYLSVDFDNDGRARCTISVGGTETFRFSHSKTLWDTGLNLATIPRSLRSMFIADDGFEIAEFDLNRGESWIYAHLADDSELIRIHREGEDFHSITAAAISSAFGEPVDAKWVEANKNGEGYKIRYLGKRVNHASAYRMGAYKGAEVINGDADDTGISVTVAQVKEAQKLWRWTYPGILQWWSGIDDQLSESRTMVTPYGRVCQFHDPMGDNLKKAATAYVPQSTSVDYLNRGMLRVFNALVKDGPVELLHQNHDSILVQYPKELSGSIVPEIISLLESEILVNGYTFTIPVEGGTGENWAEAA